MPIVFSRVEERLIHGQVSTAWAQAINFDTFVVVDNDSAKNEMLKDLLEMACPRGKKLCVFDENDAIEQINNISRKMFIIAKSPITFLNLIKNGVKITNLNIGSIHFKPGKKEIFKTVYVSEEELDALREITDMGIICEIQKLPTESKKNILDLI